MAMLYAGKTSGVLVGFVFLPLFSRQLGAEQFGVVAVILSLQALLVMLDLGMSTLISRDVGAADSSSTDFLKLIGTAELGLSGFYVILVFGAIFIKFMGGLSSIGFGTALAAVALFWLLVLQNLYYSAMLAHRAYTVASIVQVVGVIARAGATAYVLINISASLTAFVATQLIMAAIHCWVTRTFCRNFFYAGSSLQQSVPLPTYREILELLKRGKSLALFAAAGAAVMQLDKPIVSGFISAASVAPYFLATTLCMVPIAILAGPVSQYFQPILLRALARDDSEQARHVTKRFTYTLLLVTVLPSACFWLWRVPIIDLWMGQNASNAVIAAYVKILLPGFTLGALGFIPYALLLSAKDFKFQAALSGTMTVATLLASATFAFFHSVEGVCYTYAIYHGISPLASWLRAMQLSSTKKVGKLSFMFAMKSLLILFFIGIAATFISVTINNIGR